MFRILIFTLFFVNIQWCVADERIERLSNALSVSIESNITLLAKWKTEELAPELIETMDMLILSLNNLAEFAEQDVSKLSKSTKNQELLARCNVALVNLEKLSKILNTKLVSEEASKYMPYMGAVDGGYTLQRFKQLLSKS